MRISDWSSDVCSSDLIEVGFFLHHPGQRFTFPEALGARGHLAGVMGIAAEHPDGRHDRDETAVGGLVEYPADFLDLIADIDPKAARRFLRPQYLGPPVNFNLRMDASSVWAIDDTDYQLYTVLGTPSRPAHQ